MSDSVTLEVAARDTLGKAVKRLRREGLVPAVIHDHGKDSIHVQADFQALTKVFHSAGRHHPVELTLGSKKYTALIRNVAIDPRLNTITHVVFNAVSANQTVVAEIPVMARYAEGNESSPAERSGLIVLNQLEGVEVKALPKNLPDRLFYDAEKLILVGDHVIVADLEIPEGVSVETDANHALATVFEPSALAAANDEAGGDAEPGDEGEVVSDNESGSTEGTQEGEQRPGGKEEKEDSSQAKSPEKN
jgi:large subunit ribosomal protein L25